MFEIKIKNYHLGINYVRSQRRGGGLSLVIHESLRFQKYDEIIKIKCTEIEKIAVEINEKNGRKSLIIGCYRPPNSNLKKSFEELELIMEIAHLSNLPTIITGDKETYTVVSLRLSSYVV